MIAVGLDVSELRLGYAAVDYETQEPICLGVEDLRQRDGGYIEEQVPRAVRFVRSELVRLGHDAEEVVLVGIESAYHGPNIKRTIAHAGVVGMATCAAQMIFGSQAICYPLGADEWRAACGISNAGKREDKKAMTRWWAQATLIESGWGGNTSTLGEDEADALGIATACALLTETKAAA